MSAELRSIPFRGEDVAVVVDGDELLVPMKQRVEALGLDWKSQSSKIRARKWGMVIIAIPSRGGDQSTSCLPLRRFDAWVMSIQPSKVKPEARERLEAYQEELADVLWRYKSEGIAVNPRAPQVQPDPVRRSVRYSVTKGLVDQFVKLMGADRAAYALHNIDPVSFPAVPPPSEQAPVAPLVPEPIWTAAAAPRPIGKKLSTREAIRQLVKEHGEERAMAMVDGVLPPSVAPVAPISTRDQIRFVVNKASRGTGLAHNEIWKRIYSHAFYRLHINLRLIAENHGISVLQVVEDRGLSDQVLAIALELFGEYC